MLNQKKFILLLVTIFFSVSAWSSGDKNLLSAKYCNSLVENVKLENPTRIVRQNIQLCSSSPYLQEHVKSGKARYVDVNPNHTANSGNYYCSLVSEAPKGSGGLKLKKVGLKCGLRTEMHASIVDKTQKDKEVSRANAKKKAVSYSGGPYSKNTSKDVLKLAIREAKKDIANILKISAYFKKRSYNNCADHMQSQLNDFYDPLKKNVLDRFRYPKTPVYRMYTRWECSPKNFESVSATLSPDIEDEAYAASTIKPLIEKNIAMYESFLEEESSVVGISEDSKLFSDSSVEVDIDITSVVKTFFHKDSLCAVLKSSEKDVYKLECLSKLEDGFKTISWFDGMPKVSHIGICALSPMPADKRFMTYLNETYKAVGNEFKYAAPKSERDLNNTPKNLNEIGEIKCVTDVKSKSVVTKTVSTNLKEEIKKIIDGVKYNSADISEENMQRYFAAALLNKWKKNYPKVERISFKQNYRASEINSTLNIVKPELFVSEESTCIGYAARIQTNYSLSFNASGVGNGFGLAIPRTTRKNAIGDHIFGYKKCFSTAFIDNMALEKDAGFSSGLGKRYTSTVPNFSTFNQTKNLQAYQRLDRIDFSFGRSGEPELLLLKRENLGGSNSNHYNYLMNSNSASGIIAQKVRNHYHMAHRLGEFRSPYYYSEINKKTAKTISTPNKIDTMYEKNVNLCSSKELVANSCCFGLTENENSCDLKPLKLTNSILAGTASGEANQSLGSDLNFLQNISKDCLLAENKETAACKENMNMVALGFMSYMMEQYFQLQTQLMFQNFAASLQMPGADVQSLTQASNAVSLQNTQEQASSMLGLYYQSAAGAEAIPKTPVVTSAMVPLSPVPASLPNNSIFGHAYAATPYGVPFSNQGNATSWLHGGGNYGVVRDVASQVSTLQNGITNLAAQRTLLPITSSGRSISAYPASTLSNVSFPQSFYKVSNGAVIPGTSTNVLRPMSDNYKKVVSSPAKKVTSPISTASTSQGTTSKGSLVKIITDLEKSKELRSKTGLKINEIGSVVFRNSTTFPSLYLSFNRTAAMEILSPHYSQNSINMILNDAF